MKKFIAILFLLRFKTTVVMKYAKLKLSILSGLFIIVNAFSIEKSYNFYSSYKEMPIIDYLKNDCNSIHEQEKIKPNNVHDFSTNIGGVIYRFMITKDKRLLYVQSENRTSDGSTSINTSTLDNFKYYHTNQTGSQYYAYINLSGSYGSNQGFQISITSDSTIWLTSTNNLQGGSSNLGKLKFNWFN